ncbi:MAG: tRNA (adenosine(37)-N6)-threonylcarbamoyltransferase complex transferase subunit TsaD [Candidatus Omnitrophota bacterium]
MLTLGIETSCDETACAIVDDGRVMASKVSSSVHLHEPYGGVVPEIASRFHLEYINDVTRGALKEAGKRLHDVRLIAVTMGPGLAGSLMTGVSFAKALSLALRVPLVGVNHLIAHIYANFIRTGDKPAPSFPVIGLVISGGHTSIYLSEGVSKNRLLGSTQDDAVGEAFDKVAKILDLGYPGGPAIEKQAAGFKGKKPVRFPRAYLKKGSLDFSFSGVKTAVLYHARGMRKLTDAAVSEICYAFQEAVFDVICRKSVLACLDNRVMALAVGGGVAANRRLAVKLEEACTENGIKLYIPGLSMCLDNAAMVAALGEELFRNGNESGLDMTACPDAFNMTV